MLQLIKKAFTPKMSTAKMNAVIAEIHNEFDTAGEMLLKEAKAILANELPSDKGERLKKLGFVSSESAVRYSDEIKNRKEKEEIAKLIEYYQIYYPSYKFINEEVVKSICEKYGLLSGDVSFYKGDVPEKNVLEMESFKLRQEDMEAYNPYREEQESYLRMASLRQFMGSITYPQYTTRTSEQYSEVKYRQPMFKICAPEKDFDTRMLNKVGHKLELHIPDPIVLQPVKGGYLIVSKWGLEAEDKALVNEKMN